MSLLPKANRKTLLKLSSRDVHAECLSKQVGINNQSNKRIRHPESLFAEIEEESVHHGTHLR